MAYRKFDKFSSKRHWNALRDYCYGHRLRDIVDKYDVHDGYIATLAKNVGITPRPTGFASYIIAHEWVIKAKVEYEAAKAKFFKSTSSIDEDHKHHP